MGLADQLRTGYGSELTQATAATGPKNYVDECESALLTAVVASAITSGRESLVGNRGPA
jgi:hypothetical protein